MRILIQFHSRLVRGEDSQAKAALISYFSVSINCISWSTKSKLCFFYYIKMLMYTNRPRFQISSTVDGIKYLLCRICMRTGWACCHSGWQVRDVWTKHCRLTPTLLGRSGWGILWDKTLEVNVTPDYTTWVWAPSTRSRSSLASVLNQGGYIRPNACFLVWLLAK